jgi:hypothetical protein
MHTKLNVIFAIALVMNVFMIDALLKSDALIA